MKNTNVSKLSVVVIIAATLLTVAVVTGLSMIEEADARKSSSKTTTKQTITQKNIGSGSSRNSNSGSNCNGGSCQTSPGHGGGRP